MSKPISNLIESANQISLGNFDAKVSEIDQFDEIKILLSAYNKMIEEIKNKQFQLIFKSEEDENKRIFIEAILTRLTTLGALYLTLVCLMPEFLISKFPIPFYLGGTSVLIVVVVAMDTVSQVQTRLMSKQYESLIKKTKFGR